MRSIDTISFRYRLKGEEHKLTPKSLNALKAYDKVMALDCLQDIIAEATALYNDILDGAGEKDTYTGGMNDLNVSTPAADPPQCEWTMDGGIDEDAHYETACGDAWCSVLGGTPKQDNYSFCPSCGKPIIFKEAAQ